MSEENESRGFKVQDKRRFDAEGEAREAEEAAAAEAERRAQEAAAAEASRATDESAGPASEAVAATEAPAAAEADGGHVHGPDCNHGPEGQPVATFFSSFILSYASQALSFLGEMPDPESGIVRKDLEQAAVLINLIGMLHEKTQGNLTEDEARLMEELLYDLRLRYVEQTRTDGAPGAG